MRTTLILFLFFVNWNMAAQDLNTFFEKTNTFLNANVKNGGVAYKQIHENPKALNELLDLAKNAKVDVSNPATYQAFWINAYNLAVIKGVVDNYPIKSPLDKSGFFDSITYQLAGRSVTLNEIENTLLRAQFNDARVHFVLVCGAVGCPPLINSAYLPSTLEDQLNTQTTKALNGSFLKVNSKKKRVEGSEILKWYREDFVQNGTEIDFINQYRTEKIPNNYKLTYFSYNWNLNTQ